MKNRLLLIIVFFLFTLSAFSQKNVLDSLWAVHKNTNLSDSVRVTAIHQIAIKLAFATPDSGLVVGRQYLRYITERKLEKYEAGAYISLGTCYLNKGYLDSALYYFEKAVLIKRKFKDRKGEAAALNNVGIIYYQRGDYLRCLEYYHQSLTIKDSLGDRSGVAASYSNIGMIQQYEGAYSKAQESYFKSLKIRDSLHDYRGLGDSYYKIATLYRDLKNSDSANYYFRRSIVFSTKAGDLRTVANVTGNIGKSFEELGQNDSAETYFRKSLALQREVQNKEGVANSQSDLGHLFAHVGRNKEAVLYCDSALKSSREMGFAETQHAACSCLAIAYDGLGQPALALKYYKMAAELNDSLNNIEKTKEIQRKNLQYEFEKEQLADSLRRVRESELKDVSYNQKMQQQKLYTYAGIVGFVLMVLFAFVLLRGYRNKQQTNLVLEKKNMLIEEKQKAILDSITYAKRLQEAILPSLESVKQYLPDSFILYKPKDIVAGDFYWFEHINGTSYVAAADCTGHGVPGAMVSVVCSNALNRSVLEFGITDPGEILDKTRELVLETFSKSDKDVKDGMDISLAAIKGNTVQWAGANNRLWIFQNDGVLEITPDKQPIGKTDSPKPFTTNMIEINSGDQICLLTDGYADQFGGPQGKKYKYRQLKEKLAALAKVPLDRQRDELDKEFEQWRGNLEQVDDVCIIGIRL